MIIKTRFVSIQMSQLTTDPVVSNVITSQIFVKSDTFAWISILAVATAVVANNVKMNNIYFLF